MTDDRADATPPLSSPGAERSRAAFALALVLPLLFACAPRDLWSPDEPRYGLVARTMLETGDFLVPRLNGRPYAEKPPLVFASIAALGSVFGDVTALVARLACALFAVGAVFLTHRLARRWFHDESLADTAALLFSTTGLVLWNSGRAALDLPMTCFALLALLAGTSMVARPTWRAALAMGLALGAGLLVKGPHVLYVPVAAVVGGALASGAGARLRDPRWLVVPIVMFAVAAAWFFPAAARAGDALAHHSDGSFHERILGQLVSRAAGEEEPHAHGPFFLLPLLVGFGLPWAPLALVGLWTALRARDEISDAFRSAAGGASRRHSSSACPEHAILLVPCDARPGRSPENGSLTSSRALTRRASRPHPPIAPEARFGLGAAAWGLVVPLVLLSLPSSKRELYLLPLFPCAAMLAAFVLHRRASDAIERHTRRGLIALLVICGAAALLAPVASGFVPARVVGGAADARADAVAVAAAVLRTPFVVAALFGCAVLCGAGVFALSRLRRRPVGVARVAGMTLGVAAMVFSFGVLAAFDPLKTFAVPARAADHARPGVPLAIWGFSDPSVAWGFRSQRVLHLGVHTFVGAAAALRSDAPPLLVLVNTKTFRGRARRATPEARAVLDAAQVVWEGRVGGTRYLLLTNAAK